MGDDYVLKIVFLTYQIALPHKKNTIISLNSDDN